MSKLSIIVLVVLFLPYLFIYPTIFNNYTLHNQNVLIEYHQYGLRKYDTNSKLSLIRNLSMLNEDCAMISNIDKRYIEDFIFEHRPIVILGKDEVDFPVTIEYIIENSTLRSKDNRDLGTSKGSLSSNIKNLKEVVRDIVIDKFEISTEGKDEIQLKNEIDAIENELLYFDIDSEYKHGNINLDDISSINDYVISGEDVYSYSYSDVYSYIQVFKDTAKLINKDVPFYVNWYITDDCMLTVHYMFLYGNNTKQYMGQGSHKGDLESISSFYSIVNDNFVLNCIYYSAHSGNGKIYYKNTNDIIHKDGFVLKDDKRPYVFSAKHSHASYPGICTYSSTISDYTKHNKYVWDPDNIIFIDKDTSWSDFRGNFGDKNGPRRPANQKWWHNTKDTITKSTKNDNLF